MHVGEISFWKSQRRKISPNPTIPPFAGQKICRGMGKCDQFFEENGRRNQLAISLSDGRGRARSAFFLPTPAPAGQARSKVVELGARMACNRAEMAAGAGN
jgi:hypothetical protein